MKRATSEIKRFVTSDLKNINEIEDASTMTLEFNGNKRISFNDCKHFALYNVIFQGITVGFPCFWCKN
jgi:hypothetical protein